jgi:diaminohydroxyphosphoribosylaminopyrimidine deaminase / 5-amino-6-(5-phosphoribosylamino)uracil reductase
VPDGARVHPALELEGNLEDVLSELGRRGVLQLLVEGGASVAHAFHNARLVDRYVLYLAPALFGGDDARGLFAGPGAVTIGDVWRGRIRSVRMVGDDLRVDVEAA